MIFLFFETDNLLPKRNEVEADCVLLGEKPQDNETAIEQEEIETTIEQEEIETTTLTE